MRFKLKYIFLSLFIAGGCGFNALLNINGLGSGVVFASEQRPEAVVLVEKIDSKMNDIDFGDVQKLSDALESFRGLINDSYFSNSAAGFGEDAFDLDFIYGKVGTKDDLENFRRKFASIGAKLSLLGFVLSPSLDAAHGNVNEIYKVLGGYTQLKSYIDSIGIKKKDGGDDLVLDDLEATDPQNQNKIGIFKGVLWGVSEFHGSTFNVDASINAIEGAIDRIITQQQQQQSQLAFMQQSQQQGQQQGQQQVQLQGQQQVQQQGAVVVDQPGEGFIPAQGNMISSQQSQHLSGLGAGQPGVAVLSGGGVPSGAASHAVVSSTVSSTDQQNIVEQVSGSAPADFSPDTYEDRISKLSYAFESYMASGTGYMDRVNINGKNYVNCRLVQAISEEVNGFRQKYANDSDILNRLNDHFNGVLSRIFDSFDKLIEKVASGSLQTELIRDARDTIIPNTAASLPYLLSLIDDKSPEYSRYSSILQKSAGDLQNLALKTFFNGAGQQQTEVSQSQSSNQQNSIYDLASRLSSYCSTIRDYVFSSSFDNYGTYEMSLIDNKLSFLQQKVNEFVDEYEKLQGSSGSPDFETLIVDFKSTMRPIFDNLRDGVGFFAIGGNNLTKAQAYGNFFSSIKQKLLDIYSKIYPGQMLYVRKPAVVEQVDKAAMELDDLAKAVDKLGLLIFSNQNGQYLQNVQGLMRDFFGSFDAMLVKLSEVGRVNAAGTISYYEVCKRRLSDVLGIISSGNFATAQIEDYMLKISEYFSKFFGFDAQYALNVGLYEEVLKKLVPPKVIKEREEQIKIQGLTKKELETCKSLVSSVLRSTKFLLDKTKANAIALDELHGSLTKLVNIFKKYYPGNVKGAYVNAYNLSFDALRDLINMVKTETGLFSYESNIDEASLLELRKLLIEFYKMNVNFVNDTSAWYNKEFKRKSKEVDEAKKLDKSIKKPRKMIKLSRSRSNIKAKDIDKKETKKTKGKTKDKAEEAKDVKKKKKKKIVKRKRFKLTRASRSQKAIEKTTDRLKNKKLEKKKKKLAKRARSAIFSSIANFLKKFQNKSIEVDNYYLGDVYNVLVKNLKKNRKNDFDESYRRIKKILKEVDKIVAMLNKSVRASKSKNIRRMLIEKYRRFLKNKFLPLFMSKNEKKVAKLEDTKTGIIRELLETYSKFDKFGFDSKSYDKIINLRDKFVEKRKAFFDDMTKIFSENDSKKVD